MNFTYDDIDEEQAHKATAQVLQWAYPLVLGLRPFDADHNKGSFAALTMLFVGWLAREIKPFTRHADCKNKCSYCCYQMVQVSPVEAFRIAMVMKDTSLPKVQEAAERLSVFNKQSVIEQRFRQGIPCVFLSNQSCGIYAVRPTTCATFLSLDVRKCKAGWEGRFMPEIPGADYIKGPQNIGIAGQMALDFAFWKKGIQIDHWELSYAVSAAMKPGALDNWLTGGQVFDPERRFLYQDRGREGFYSKLMELMDRSILLKEVE